MIPTSDLRKGNLIKTGYGILPVHAIVFDQVQVKGNDGRILWAKEVEGVEINNELLLKLEFIKNENILEPVFYEIKNVVRIYKDKILICVIDENNFRRWGSINYRCIYVHELQNLYVALTGEELTIK